MESRLSGFLGSGESMIVYVVVFGHGYFEEVFSTVAYAEEYISKQWHPEDYRIYSVTVDEWDD